MSTFNLFDYSIFECPKPFHSSNHGFDYSFEYACQFKKKKKTSCLTEELVGTLTILLFLLLTLNIFLTFSSVSIVDFEQVNGSWGRNCCRCRSSHLHMIYEIGVFKNFAKFTGKHLFRNLFFHEVAV